MGPGPRFARRPALRRVSPRPFPPPEQIGRTSLPAPYRSDAHLSLPRNRSDAPPLPQGRTHGVSRPCRAAPRSARLRRRGAVFTPPSLDSLGASDAPLMRTLFLPRSVSSVAGSVAAVVFERIFFSRRRAKTPRRAHRAGTAATSRSPSGATQARRFSSESRSAGPRSSSRARRGAARGAQPFALHSIHPLSLSLRDRV